jgi:hypothetical protein
LENLGAGEVRKTGGTNESSVVVKIAIVRKVHHVGELNTFLQPVTNFFAKCFLKIQSPDLQTILGAQESIFSPAESIPGLLKRLQVRAQRFSSVILFSRCQQKISIFYKLFAYYVLKEHLLQFSDKKVIKRYIKNSKDQSLSYFICLMFEGSGSVQMITDPDPKGTKVR